MTIMPKSGLKKRKRIENRLSPTHALISTNFDAGSSNLLPEWRETARNLGFCQNFEIIYAKIAKLRL